MRVELQPAIKNLTATEALVLPDNVCNIHEAAQTSLPAHCDSCSMASLRNVALANIKIWF